MPRTRNIKPGFFKNEELAECSMASRLLFAGLWTLADREGRLEDRPKRIKADIFPYEDIDCDTLLNELRQKNFIIRYENSKNKFIQICTFTVHQQPHYKEVASVIAAPDAWQDSGVTAGGVPEILRLKIIERDKKCLSCGSNDDLTLDHIKPRSAGGTHGEENLQTLCRKCNSSKNNSLASKVNIESTLGQQERSMTPLNPSSLTLNPSPKAPLPPPKLSTGRQGKNGNAGDFASPSPRYSIVHKLTDSAHEKAKLLCKSLNRDFYHLAAIYDDGVISGKRPPPASPDSAFPAWISAYTKNERL